MKTYQEVRKESADKLHALMNEVEVFWAFSNEQFKEGMEKHPLKEGDKYVSIGHGGYMPKSNVNKFLTGSKTIDQWEKSEMKKIRDGKEQHILHELTDHECFYTCDIEDAVSVLPYPRKDIIKVYYKYKEEYQSNL